jgi:hypothetical protein
VSRYNGEPVQNAEIIELLESMGFEKGYQELILWPSKRGKYNECEA